MLASEGPGQYSWRGGGRGGEEQGWFRGERARLAPRVLSGFSGFPLSIKTNTPKFQFDLGTADVDPLRGMCTYHCKFLFLISFYFMLFYVILCYFMSCHVTSRHVTSCHVTSHHVMSCHVTLRYVTLFHFNVCDFVFYVLQMDPTAPLVFHKLPGEIAKFFAKTDWQLRRESTSLHYALLCQCHW